MKSFFLAAGYYGFVFYRFGFDLLDVLPDIATKHVIGHGDLTLFGEGVMNRPRRPARLQCFGDIVLVIEELNPALPSSLLAIRRFHAFFNSIREFFHRIYANRCVISSLNSNYIEYFQIKLNRFK